MAEIIPEGFAQLELTMRHALLTRPALVTWGQAHTGSVTVGTVNALWGVVFNAIDSTTDSSVTIGPLKAVVGTATDEHLVVQGSSFGVGTVVATGFLNAGQAVLVRKLTSRGGRRGRGRFYWPWIIDEGSINEVGQLDASAVANLEALFDQLLIDIAAVSGWDEMVVLHSPSGEDVEPPTTPGSPNTVTNLQVDPIVGSMRRRLNR
jgi:hypothetical protein